jgi:uncharacterized protein YecE (DUF72 family)
LRLQSDAPPLAGGASWGYLRLRRSTYDDTALAGWVARVRAQPWQRALVFFKHEDAGAGPALAARFLELAGRARERRPPAARAPAARRARDTG